MTQSSETATGHLQMLFPPVCPVVTSSKWLYLSTYKNGQ